MSGQYKVAWLCEALLVSRSGYYDWKERRRNATKMVALPFVICKRAASGLFDG